jgi:hypothetical protein
MSPEQLAALGIVGRNDIESLMMDNGEEEDEGEEENEVIFRTNIIKLKKGKTSDMADRTLTLVC